MKKIIFFTLAILIGVNDMVAESMYDEINQTKKEGTPYSTNFSNPDLDLSDLGNSIATTRALYESGYRVGQSGPFVSGNIAREIGKSKYDERLHSNDLLKGSLEDFRARKQSEELKSLSNTISIIIGLTALGGILAFIILAVRNGYKENGFSEPKSLYEKARELSTPLIVEGYRRVAAERSIAPTSRTSDEKIIQIYRQVGSAFNEASMQRGEHIPAVYLNNIILKFLQVYELGEDMFFNEHLKYEVDKYTREGLREDYKREISLIF